MDKMTCLGVCVCVEKQTVNKSTKHKYEQITVTEPRGKKWQ